MADTSSESYTFEAHSAAGATACSTGFTPADALFPHPRISTGGHVQTIQNHPDFASPELVDSSDVHQTYLKRFWIDSGPAKGVALDYWIRLWSNQTLNGGEFGGMAEWGACFEWHEWGTSRARLPLDYVQLVFENEIFVPAATAEGYSQGTWSGTEQTFQWDGYEKSSGGEHVMFHGRSPAFYGEMYLRPAEAGNETQYTAAKAGRMAVGFATGEVWDGYWGFADAAPPPPADPTTTNGTTLKDLTVAGESTDLRGMANGRWTTPGGVNGFGITFGGPWISAQLGTVDQWMWNAMEWGHRSNAHLRQQNGLPWIVDDNASAWEHGAAGNGTESTYGKSGLDNNLLWGKGYDEREETLPGTHGHTHFFALLKVMTQWPWLKQWVETAGQWVTHFVRYHPKNIGGSAGETRNLWRYAQSVLTLADACRDNTVVRENVKFSLIAYYNKFRTDAWSPTSRLGWSAQQKIWVGTSTTKSTGDCRNTAVGDYPWTDSQGVSRQGTGSWNAVFAGNAAMSAYFAGQWLKDLGTAAFASESLEFLYEFVQWATKWTGDGDVVAMYGQWVWPWLTADPGTNNEAKQWAWNKRAEVPLINGTPYDYQTDYFTQKDGCVHNAHNLPLMNSSNGISQGWTSGSVLLAQDLLIDDGTKANDLRTADAMLRWSDWSKSTGATGAWGDYSHHVASVVGIYGHWKLQPADPVWDTGDIDLSWRSALTTDWTFDIQRSTSRTGTFTNVTTGLTTSTYTDTTVTEGTEYWYKIKATHKVWSNITLITRAMPVELEVGVPVTQQTSQAVAVGWDADNGATLTDYDLQVADSPHGPWTNVQTGITGSPLGAAHYGTSGQAYFYRVAVNYSGGTLYSRIGVGMWDFPAVAPLKSAVVLSGAGAAGQNELTWESCQPAPLQDIESHQTSGVFAAYTVFRDGNPLAGSLTNPSDFNTAEPEFYDENTNTRIKASNDLTFNDTTATVGFAHDYFVLAVDAQGNASMSNEISVTRPS